jgi:hypothetical protein
MFGEGAYYQPGNRLSNEARPKNVTNLLRMSSLAMSDQKSIVCYWPRLCKKRAVEKWRLKGETNPPVSYGQWMIVS